MSPGPSDEASRALHATVIDAAVLSERRAQRAESAEQALAERAAAAERAVVSMEQRLSEAESRLEAVVWERDELADEVARLDRELTLALQREFAEQQVRLDTEGELVLIQRAAEEEIADLRSRLADAEHAVARMEAEVARAREQAVAVAAAGTGADGAGARDEAERQLAADLAELQAALDARLRAVMDRMGVLRHEVAGSQAALERRLVAEIAARQSAEAWVEAHRAGAKEAGAIGRGEAARLIAVERERAAALVAIQRGRADAEAAARREAEAELARLRDGGGATPAAAEPPTVAGLPTVGEPPTVAGPPEPPTVVGPPTVAEPPAADPQDARARAVQAEIVRLQALRAEPAPAGATVPTADLIVDLGRAAERLRAQAAEAQRDVDAAPPRKQWWRPSWWRQRKLARQPQT